MSEELDFFPKQAEQEEQKEFRTVEELVEQKKALPKGARQFVEVFKVGEERCESSAYRWDSEHGMTEGRLSFMRKVCRDKNANFIRQDFLCSLHGRFYHCWKEGGTRPSYMGCPRCEQVREFRKSEHARIEDAHQHNQELNVSVPQVCEVVKFF